MGNKTIIAGFTLLIASSMLEPTTDKAFWTHISMIFGSILIMLVGIKAKLERY